MVWFPGALKAYFQFKHCACLFTFVYESKLDFFCVDSPCSGKRESRPVGRTMVLNVRFVFSSCNRNKEVELDLVSLGLYTISLYKYVGRLFLVFCSSVVAPFCLKNHHVKNYKNLDK